jgi:sugar-specific transcriptional regulator TrmB
MDIAELEHIGLKEKEAKIYIVLLKEGSILANQLAKRTGILRASIYDYLDVLIEKGFASYTISSGKKYFQAVNPEKLIDSFEEQKRIEEEALKSLVPKLSAFQNIPTQKSVVEVFEGKEGIKTAMSTILKENPKELRIYGSSGVGYELLPAYLEHWHNKRIKNKINIRIIYNDVIHSRERINKGPSLKLAKIRFFPIKDESFTGTILYNNVILITFWNKESPLAIQITSKDISKNYNNNFEVLWKIAKK